MISACAVYWTVRPFGSAALMGVKGRDGYELYLLEPNGDAFVCCCLYPFPRLLF